MSLGKELDRTPGYVFDARPNSLRQKLVVQWDKVDPQLKTLLLQLKTLDTSEQEVLLDELDSSTRTAVRMMLDALP